MQKFFQELQGELWLWLIEVFKKTTDFSIETWTNLKPYLEIGFFWFEKSFQYLTSSASDLFSISINSASSLENNIQSLFSKNYTFNKYNNLAVIIVFVLVFLFWIWMIVHAKRNEILHKKIWITIILLLGPVGALIYYIFRKRKLEIEQKRRDKVMMSFFTPMHQNNDRSDKKV